MSSIDINCDLGESFGNYRIADDLAFLPFISSANIACGFHAGDPGIIHQTVQVAVRHDVAIGAHPGLPDLQGFGRRKMTLTPAEVYQLTLYQIGALHAFVRAANAVLHHVKPHGALYWMVEEDEAIAKSFAQAVADFDQHLLIYCMAGGAMQVTAKSLGLSVAQEGFADRRYLSEGKLLPRSENRAIIIDSEELVSQLSFIIHKKQVIGSDGSRIPVNADSVCIHSDTAGAVMHARAMHHFLLSNNIEIKAVSR